MDCASHEEEAAAAHKGAGAAPDAHACAWPCLRPPDDHNRVVGGLPPAPGLRGRSLAPQTNGWGGQAPAPTSRAPSGGAACVRTCGMREPPSTRSGSGRRAEFPSSRLCQVSCDFPCAWVRGRGQRRAGERRGGWGGGGVRRGRVRGPGWTDGWDAVGGTTCAHALSQERLGGLPHRPPIPGRRLQRLAAGPAQGRLAHATPHPSQLLFA